MPCWVWWCMGSRSPGCRGLRKRRGSGGVGMGSSSPGCRGLWERRGSGQGGWGATVAGLPDPRLTATAMHTGGGTGEVTPCVSRAVRAHSQVWSLRPRTLPCAARSRPSLPGPGGASSQPSRVSSLPGPPAPTRTAPCPGIPSRDQAGELLPASRLPSVPAAAGASPHGQTDARQPCRPDPPPTRTRGPTWTRGATGHGHAGTQSPRRGCAAGHGECGPLGPHPPLGCRTLKVWGRDGVGAAGDTRHAPTVSPSHPPLL